MAVWTHDCYGESGKRQPTFGVLVPCPHCGEECRGEEIARLRTLLARVLEAALRRVGRGIDLTEVQHIARAALSPAPAESECAACSALSAAEGYASLCADHATAARVPADETDGMSGPAEEAPDAE